jgi:hypothetical protein
MKRINDYQIAVLTRKDLLSLFRQGAYQNSEKEKT